jgi:outer membrane protein, heavy metal efflux system
MRVFQFGGVREGAAMPTRPTHFSLFAAFTVGALSWIAPAGSAQPLDKNAEDTFVRALLQSPALKAATSRAEAAQTRAGSAGRLADPMLEGMYGRMSTPSERFPMWQLSVQQELPKRGERAADRELARSELAMVEAESAMNAVEIAAEVAGALAEAEAAASRTRLLQQQQQRMRDVLAAIDARIGAGRDSLASRLVLQTRIQTMQLAAEREQRSQADAESLARGLLGLGDEHPLPPFVAPALGDIRPDETADAAQAKSRKEQSDAMIRVARAKAKPATAVGVHFEREQMSMGNEDRIALSFRTDLPWRARRYANSDVRAALSEREAADYLAEAARHRATAALKNAERAERLAASTLRYTEATRTRLEAEYEALVRSAATGGPNEASLLMVLETLERVTETEMAAVDAIAAERAARAALWRFAPADTFRRPSTTP